VGLFKTPPRVAIRAPTVVAGVPFRIEVDLECTDVLPVEYVSVLVRGRFVFFAEASAATPPTIALRSVVLVRGGARLGVGTHRYVADFVLPADVPGSHAGARFGVDWKATVHVSIPWWPDTRYSQPLVVIQPPRPGTGPAPPSVYPSHPNGPMGRLPYAEVSLASTAVRRGDVIQGFVSLANTRQVRYRRVQLRLTQSVWAPMLSLVGDAVSATVLHIDPRVRDNQPMPFAVRVPMGAIPAFRFRDLSMRWQFECQVQTDSMAELRLAFDVDVLPRTVAASETAAPSLAAIGAERLHNTWLQASTDTGWSFESGTLVRRFDDATLTLALEQSSDGTELVADARFSEVDIGVHEDDGRLRCRDAAHTQAIADATDVLAKKYRVHSADDRHLQYRFRDGGRRRDALVVLARWFETLVRTLLDTRRELPAPASVAHLTDRWTRAARMLDGRLVAAGMDVWGNRDGLAFGLETRWDGKGELATTTLAVGTTIDIDARYRGSFVPEAWPEARPEGLEALLDGAIGLTVVPRGIELHLPPSPEDIVPVVERLEALIAIARRLSMLDRLYR